MYQAFAKLKFTKITFSPSVELVQNGGWLLMITVLSLRYELLEPVNIIVNSLLFHETLLVREIGSIEDVEFLVLLVLYSLM